MSSPDRAGAALRPLVRWSVDAGRSVDLGRSVDALVDVGGSVDLGRSVDALVDVELGIDVASMPMPRGRTSP
jgi:hypothetical protein